MIKGKDVFKLILKSKSFIIPSNFTFIKDVRNEIYISLITQKQYKVKSNVKEEIFQSFLNHWISKEIPNINANNITEYKLLSEEFDRMKDLIQTYIIYIRNNDERLLIANNQNSKQIINSYFEEITQKTKIYQNIIYNLFNNTGIDSYPRFLEVKSDLFNSCKNENLKFADLLTRKEIKQNGLSFIINEDEMTSGVLRNVDSKDDIFIPQSIFYESKEFIVTHIFENAFKNSKNIKSIEFPENSELKYIEKNAFMNSSLESIFIPSKVTIIDERCFSGCVNLSKIEFQIQSELKSIEKEAFSMTSLETIAIPSSVTRIGESVFNYCKHLQSIEFSIDSELNSIDKFAFLGTAIESITIPPKVCELKDGWCAGTSMLNRLIVMSGNRFFAGYKDKFIIGKSNVENVNYDVLICARRNMKRAVIPPFIRRIGRHAFDECEQLKAIEFSEGSQLYSIDKYAFSNSTLKCISIPSNVSELKNGWCAGTLNLTTVSVSPCNKDLIYLNDTFIIGKSDTKSDNFDVLLFARRNVTRAIIPSFVTCIAPYAFHQCSQLQSIEFSEHSKLNIIEKYAFSFSSLRSITIPSHVKKICKSAFYFCSVLQKVDFANDSELNSIEKYSFFKSSIQSITIPSSVTQICEAAFHDCIQLKTVEFANNSKLNVIERYAFSTFSLEKISIPPKVCKLEEGWCYSAVNLKQIEIMQNNRHFLYFDDSFILKKTNVDNDEFDILAFSRRNITRAIIPPSIKEISTYAFARCQNLQCIEFTENSQLKSIKKNAFLNSSIKSISIPSNISQIEDSAFPRCTNLKIIEISEHSKLILFDKAILGNSLQVILMIPPKLMKIYFN